MGQLMQSVPHGMLHTITLCCALYTGFNTPVSAHTPSVSMIHEEGKTIKGLVLDTNNEPLIGVTILVKGTTKGTVTDYDGKFELEVPKGSTLIVSYIGMRSQEIHVSGTNNYQIIMDSDTELLDEVVVTGYQTLSKERSTGSFAKVNSKALETKRMDNLGSMLEGRVAGYVDGKIRGITTMNATTCLIP